MYIVIILVLVAIITVLEKKIQDNNKFEEINIENTKSYADSYCKKEYLLTPTELKFYKLLKSITDKLDFSLFIQVSLYELVNYKDYKDFNKIKSKSIDFVITERNCKIKMCIELDDKTHYTTKRIERDKFINKLFEDVGIKLIRIPVQNYYNLEELEKKIKE